MVPTRLRTVTPRHLVVDQSKPFSLVKLVGPSAAVCRRCGKILPHGSKVSRSKSRPCRAESAVEGGERECGCGRRATTASFIPNRQGLRRHAGQQGVVPRCKHTYTGSLPVTRTRRLLPQSFLTSLAGCLLMPVVSSYELRRYLRYASRSSLCSSLLLFPLTTL